MIKSASFVGIAAIAMLLASVGCSASGGDGTGDPTASSEKNLESDQVDAGALPTDPPEKGGAAITAQPFGGSGGGGAPSGASNGGGAGGGSGSNTRGTGGAGSHPGGEETRL